MNILIITTYMSPDTAVAAVRPYMFAKYLSLKGHNVTVLRSGEILASIDDSYDAEKYNVQIISYLGEDSDAEKYKRGMIKSNDVKHLQSRISFLPIKVRKKVSCLYHSFLKTYEYKKEEETALKNLIFQKKAIDELSDEKFDIVFSTYGRLENVFAGAYAKDKLKCPWILDLRDRIAHDKNKAVRRIQEKTEREYIELADACTVVSKVYCDEIIQKNMNSNAYLVNNGYDNIDNLQAYIKNETVQKLIFCYTGSMYTGNLTVGPLFSALQFLSAKKVIDLQNIEFVYAGSEYEYIYEQASKYHVESILINRGYLGREEIKHIQANTDIFVVAARNTKYMLGELTAKFYEGIRAHKPILTIISGEVPKSELGVMQRKYNYGHCYEQSDGKKSFIELCKYIKKCYKQKILGQDIEYHPKKELFYDFRYDTLADKLEQIMVSLVNK